MTALKCVSCVSMRYIAKGSTVVPSKYQIHQPGAEGDETVGQGVDDPVDESAEDHHHEQDESVPGIEILIFKGEFSRQEHGQNLGTIQRRYGNEIEKSKPYVVQHDPVQKTAAFHRQHAETVKNGGEKDGKEPEK